MKTCRENNIVIFMFTNTVNDMLNRGNLHETNKLPPERIGQNSEWECNNAGPSGLQPSHHSMKNDSHFAVKCLCVSIKK